MINSAVSESRNNSGGSSSQLHVRACALPPSIAHDCYAVGILGYNRHDIVSLSWLRNAPADEGELRSRPSVPRAARPSLLLPASRRQGCITHHRKYSFVREIVDQTNRTAGQTRCSAGGGWRGSASGGGHLGDRLYAVPMMYGTFRHRRLHGSCPAAGIRIQRLHAPSGTFKVALLICLICLHAP